MRSGSSSSSSNSSSIINNLDLALLIYSFVF